MTLSLLVTGSNRGIGLSLCKHYKNMGYTVFAACRKASPALSALDVEIFENIDITDPRSGIELAELMKKRPLDLLINNAGILRDEQLGKLNIETIEEQFKVNTLGPLSITEALLPLINNGGENRFYY